MPAAKPFHGRLATSAHNRTLDPDPVFCPFGQTFAASPYCDGRNFSALPGAGARMVNALTHRPIPGSGRHGLKRVGKKSRCASTAGWLRGGREAGPAETAYPKPWHHARADVCRPWRECVGFRPQPHRLRPCRKRPALRPVTPSQRLAFSLCTCRAPS